MSIKVKNLNQVIKKLKKFGEDGNRIVKREIDISATNIERNAINSAPSRLDSLDLNIKQRIDKEITNQGFTAKVGVQGATDMDAYIEFGTGLNFLEIVNSRPQDYTPEILAVAKKFYKNGQGTLIGTPYLFPAFFKEGPELIANLKKELETLAKKT